MTEQTNARPQGTDIVRLTDLAAQLLGQAKAHPSQRAAQTIHSGSSMRATVIAWLRVPSSPSTSHLRRRRSRSSAVRSGCTGATKRHSCETARSPTSPRTVTH